MGLLADGATILTPDADWQLYGSASGTLKILYASGDYYDVNVITQVNFLIDGDQSIQASASAGTEQGLRAATARSTKLSSSIPASSRPPTISAAMPMRKPC